MEMQNQQLVKLSLGQPHDQPISSLPAGLRRTSSYCIFVKLPKRQDRVLLVHGYTGAYDEVSLDVASFLSSRRTVSAPCMENGHRSLTTGPTNLLLPKRRSPSLRTADTSPA
jgi:hypothetical protein